ncbi:MAG: acetyl-CoA C-acetyltransferase [Dehalococcoidia bacterium]|jgi:acetyl-CoA C-acetyltransferase|nr:MAG: acetyl-CoA C-acetyltransferase [Dehalococcoidia bacterium]
MPDKEVVIVNGARTAIGRFEGVIRDLTVIDIGVAAVKEALKKSGVNPEQLDEVIIGHARQAGCGPNAARIVSINAGIPANVPAYTVNLACVSGMLAIMLAYQSITLGNADIVLAGGMEHHSSIPFLSMNTRWGARMGDVTLVDAMYKDGYHCGIEHVHMGLLADVLAEELGITREEQDRFALESQQKAAKAKESGFFAKTIVPVEIPQRKGAPIVFQEDECPRPDSTLEVLARLRPVFRPDGTITAGNAPPIPNGASAVVVTSREKSDELGLKPLGRILSYAVTSVEPKRFAVAPVSAVRKALAKAGLTLDEIDLIEINEAFAAQVIAVSQELQWDMSRVNIHGGGVALGHPTGMSGNRITLDVLNSLAERGGRYGLATLCGNGGHGGAIVLELIK